MKSLLELASDLPFERGDVVYHSQALVREPGIVVGIMFYHEDFSFYVAWGNRVSTYHGPLELTKTFVSEEARALKTEGT